MAAKINVYNGVLNLLGLRHLEALTDHRQERRVIDSEWDKAVAHCLASGVWNFAMRDTSIAQSGAGSMGFTYYVTKPSDLVHLFLISAEADFDPPLQYSFSDQGDRWHVNSTPIYVRYISSDASYGGDVSKWPGPFVRYVEASLACMLGFRLTRNAGVVKMAAELEQARYIHALNICSVTAPPGMRPFNAEARNPTQVDSPHGAERILPFGKAPVPFANLRFDEGR